MGLKKNKHYTLHLIFKPSLSNFQSQNPQNSTTIHVALLNQIRQT